MSFKDGESNGSFEEYYANGQLKIKAGMTKEYDVDQRMFQISGRSRTLSGSWTSICQDCDWLAHYQQLPLYGAVELYHEDGRSILKVTYQNGKQHGPFEYYHKNGELAGKETYQDGWVHGPYVSYHENGQLWEKGTYQNGKPHGPSEMRYENGQPLNLRTYKNGKKDGIHRIFYKDNGEVTYVRNFRAGKKDGIESYFSGNYSSEDCFKNDEVTDMSYCKQ